MTEPPRRDIFLKSLLATTAILVIGIAIVSADEPPPREEPAATVELIVDYGDGAQKRLTEVPWKKDMTVLDVMRYATDHPHGITYEHRGKGEIAFLSKIDDVENEGGGGRNWIFYTGKKDEDRGQSSFAVAKPPVGSTILWRFEEYK